MVLSKLDPSISYIEQVEMDPEDINYDASMYAVDIMKTPLLIALGKQKNKFVDKNIIFFPIYLIKDTKQTDTPQIGVFEARYSDLPNLLDEDGDIDIEDLGSPLLYSFSDDTFLKKSSNETSKKIMEEIGKQLDDTKEDQHKEGDDENTEDDDNDNDYDYDEDEEEHTDDDDDDDSENDDNDDEMAKSDLSDVFSVTSNVDNRLLEEETADDSKQIEAAFSDDQRKPWIQRFMKNDNYTIDAIEKGGDCLFYTIKMAFSQIGKITSVAALRAKLAKEVDQKLYVEYKEHYNMYVDALKDDTKELKQLAKQHNELKKRLSSTKSKSTQDTIVLEAKQVEEAFRTAKGAQSVSRSILEEFQYMSRINSASEFKEFIQTCEFWAETWAISTLERILNIKFIMLSLEEYDAKDYYNVLECGELNDDILKRRGVFKPDYYIIVEHDQDNYHLISYKNKGIFTFREIPYTLREMIITKCMERNESPYSIIPDFRSMQSDLGLGDVQEGGLPVIDMPIDMGDLDCEQNITFIISDTANPNQMPGRGQGEEIPIGMLHEFAALANIPNWRQILSPNYMQPIEIDGHMWPSVTHYYEGSKFKKEHPEYYLLFSEDSGSDIARDPYMAKAIGEGKTTYHGREINPEKVKIDRDFYTKKEKGRSSKELSKALEARGKQDKTFKKALKATKRARLMSSNHGKKPKLDKALVKLRGKI